MNTHFQHTFMFKHLAKLTFHLMTPLMLCGESLASFLSQGFLLDWFPFPIAYPSEDSYVLAQ